MLRRIVAALVVLGLLAHAQLFAAHQAMALAASFGGDDSANWLCLTSDTSTSPASRAALDDLKRALGQSVSTGDDPQKPASSCPVCFGLVTAFLLPSAGYIVAPATFDASPPASPVLAALHSAAKFCQPPGHGPPSPSV